jgi:hypothetical protein
VPGSGPEGPGKLYRIFVTVTFECGLGAGVLSAGLAPCPPGRVSINACLFVGYRCSYGAVRRAVRPSLRSRAARSAAKLVLSTLNVKPVSMRVPRDISVVLSLHL